MVHLVGVTNHNVYQLVSRFRERNDDLRDYLDDFLDNNNVDLLAEEMTEDASSTLGFEAFVCVEIAEKHEIEHQFVELEKMVRDDLGIASDDYAAREAHWLSRIEDVLNNGGNVLFVCGADHIESFSALLIFEGYDVEVAPIVGEA